MTDTITEQSIREEIAHLEQCLQAAQAKLKASSTPTGLASTPSPNSHNPSVSHHPLLLLSDSALPLGSFAFSSGLESYLAHHRPLKKGTKPSSSFPTFLHLSIASLAASALPYLLAAHRCPENLETLDNDLDASMPCTVARRASVAQGRALLSVWDRALCSAAEEGCGRAAQALAAFAVGLKRTVGKVDDIAAVNGHFALVWAVTCRGMGLGEEQMVYVFLFNHAKAVLSAAVRASVMGPYQAQGILASVSLQHEIAEAVRGNWDVEVEDAAQVVPVMDLWVGRHELLYSRIFNS